MLEQYTQTAIDIANAANGMWETFADIDGENVPPNELDAMQVKLCRWQRANFGDVSPIDKVDVHMGLGVIEEFGETIGATELGGSKGKLDGLGDICVYAGQILNANRMAIRPVMDLADLIAADLNDEDNQAAMEPAALSGSFAHILLKHEQKIRGYDKREVWLAQLAVHIAAFMAYAKMDIMWTYYDSTDLDVHVNDEQLIQRTYIEVGGGVVLKRNWTADRIAGQTPA